MFAEQERRPGQRDALFSAGRRRQCPGCRRRISGLVVHAAALQGIETDGKEIAAEAGSPISAVSEAAAAAGLSGLEFIYRMPGSVGGAVWMNARCYGESIADKLAWVDYLDADGEAGRYVPRRSEFAYKRSPFQDGRRVITRVGFSLKPDARDEIGARMEKHGADRVQKGHFRYPCAGSVFKNNRNFGAPTGQLIDALGMKGIRRGGAMIAPFHGNIIINLGNARAADILELILLAEKRVREAYGFELERELVLVGNWNETIIE